MKKNIVEPFIRDLIVDQIMVTIFLINGIKLYGSILEQDDNAVVLEHRMHGKQVVFKHSIATIVRGTYRDINYNN